VSDELRDDGTILAHVQAQRIAQQRVKSAKGGTRYRREVPRVVYWCFRVALNVKLSLTRAHASISESKHMHMCEFAL
jgi:hypothetical protein